MKHTIRNMVSACILGLCFFYTAQSQEPTWLFAQRYGGVSHENGTSIAVNASGIYSCGSFSNSVIFGSTIQNASGGSDIYVARFTPQAQAVWSQKAGGSGDDKATSIALSSGGDVYVTGWFTGTVTFGLQQLVSAGGKDVFVAKYNADGALQWVRRAGSVNDDLAYGIAVNGNNVYISGSFVDSTRFGSLAMMRAVGKTDYFIAAYTSTGTEVWSQQGGSTKVALAKSIVATPTAVYIGGSFNDTLRLAGNVVTAGGHDVFAAKYNVNGAYQWVRRWGRVGDDMVNDIELTPNQKLVIGGSYASDTLIMGSVRLPKAGVVNGFLARIDTINGAADWGTRVGGNGNTMVNSVAVDGANAMYATGDFSTAFTQGGISVTNAGANDLFALKYTSAGALEFLRSAGGPSNDVGYGVAVNAIGESYYTGNTYFRSKFDQNVLNGNGDNDAFIARLSIINSLDAGVTSIIVPTVPFAQGVQQVSAVVKNYGTQRIDSVRIVWTFNGTPQTMVRYTTPINPGQTATVVLGSPTFPAKTLSSITASTQFPNGVVDVNEINDSRSVRLGPGLSAGEYTVGGSSPDFVNLLLANEYLHTAGVLGKVIFNVRSGNYEGPLEFSAIPGLVGERRRIEFRKDEKAATNPVVSFGAIYPNNNYVLSVDGTDWLSFTNINFASSGGSLYAKVVTLQNNTRALMFDGCAFNFVLNNNATADDNFSIVDENICDSLTIKNCTFNGGFDALDLGQSTTKRQNITISGNTLTNFKTTGISCADVNAPVIVGNKLTTNATAVIGIWVLETTGGMKMTNNVITGLPSGAGVFITDVMSSEAERSLISNNMIQIGSVPADEMFGLVLVNSQYCNVYHNTVNNTSNDKSHSALLIDGGSNINLVNNIFYNSGGGRAVDVDYEYTSPISTSDFNNLYTNGPILVRWTLGMDSDTLFNIQQLRDQKGIDINSVSRNITFGTDKVHLTLVDEVLYGSPTVLNTVGTDIDGQPRRNYYRGADEIIPVISLTKQPSRTIVCEGDVVVFEVKGSITNAGALKYQWQKNGVNITDSVRNRLVILNSNYDNDGFYRCIVSGNSGADTVYTTVGQLSVTTRTLILREPNTNYLLTGDNARFDVLAEAAPIVSIGKVRYTWLRGNTVIQNSQRISGQGTPVLQIFSVQPADTGRNYRVIVEGACGSDTSAFVSLLLPGGTFSVQPKDENVCLNQDVQLTAQIKTNINNPTIIYQWRKGGNPITDDTRITGSKTNTLKITGVTPADTIGEYSLYVRIEELNSEFISNPVKVTLKKPTRVVAAPQNTNACPGKPVTLNVNAEGAGVRYQWQLNEQNIAGATNAAYTIPSLDNQTIGRYRVVVTGDCGTITSDVANVGLIDPARFLNNPPSVIVLNPGQQLIINVAAGGQIPITYQWYKNGVKVDGQILNPYFKNNITFADSGTYYCVAKNVCDSAKSTSVRVVIAPTSVEDEANSSVSDISVTPNPASLSTTLSFNTMAQTVYTVSVTDVTGRVLTTMNGIANGTRESIELSTEKLGFVTGTYYCTVSSGNKRLTIPVVFIR